MKHSVIDCETVSQVDKELIAGLAGIKTERTEWSRDGQGC